MLILSLLVGSLLVGRQIVDRAKIQRIIFEFDYYEKAFHQFYDTYRYVPGALPYKECTKYSAFVNYPNSKYKNFCDCIGIKNDSPHSAKLIYGWYGYSSYTVAPQFALSGLIEEKPLVLRQMNNGLYFCPSGNGFLVGHWTNNSSNALKSAFSEQTWIQIVGFHFDRMITSGFSLENYKKYAFATSNTLFNSSFKHELDDNNFRKAIDKHNAIVFYYFQNAFLSNYNSQNDINNNARTRTQISAISAKFASELDAKVDDGRPGSGKILAMKGSVAHYAGATSKEHLDSCYDKNADEISKAIYNSSTDQKYGCNIIKVMEDVK